MVYTYCRAFSVNSEKRKFKSIFGRKSLKNGGVFWSLGLLNSCSIGFRGNNLRVSLFKGVVKTGNMPDYAQPVSDNPRF